MHKLSLKSQQQEIEMLRITIQTTNDVFVDADWKLVVRDAELARLLRETANKIESGHYGTSGFSFLIDDNGNECGRVELTSNEEDAEVRQADEEDPDISF